MFTKEQFNNLKKAIKAYWGTLDIREVRAEFTVKGLLTQNKKLKKGDALNFGMELLPSILAPGMNLCTGAGECRYSCLAFSGVGNIIKGKKMLDGFQELTAPIMAKARRTFLYAQDPESFHAILDEDIREAIETASKDGVKAAFRLNTTSDIDWKEVAARWPSEQFYDYTKVWSREGSGNYHLTYSFSELTNAEMAMRLLQEGKNVAMVFPKDLPDIWKGYPVIDGDIDDNRYLDPAGVVVGLRMKTTIGGGDKVSTFAKAAS